MSSEFARVAIKAGNLRKKDLSESKNNAWVIEGNAIQPLHESIPKDGYPKEFDLVFDQDASNKQVFDDVVAPIVASTFEGYNGTIFAYGPTASGKLFIMEGTIMEAGIIPRAIDDVFKLASKGKKNSNYLIRCANFMIYDDKIYDLLNYIGKDVDVINLPSGEITIASKEAVISQKSQAFDLFQLGLKNRALYIENCDLKINHCNMVFRIIVEHDIKHGWDTVTPTAHLNLVTLGGSERVTRPVDTPRFVERDFVDKTLSTFTSIITNRIDKNPVEYRDSMLTMLFRNTIFGNAKTAYIVTFLKTSVENTFFALNFAQTVRKIQNMPTINIIGTNNVLRQVLTEIHNHENDLKDVKRNSDVLSAASLIKQACELLQARIRLLQLVITKPQHKTKKVSESSIDETTLNFNKLIFMRHQIDFSTIEVRIVNVLVANQLFNAEYIGKKVQLPFEMLYFNLSAEVGNEFVSQTPENLSDEINVPDYLIETYHEDELDMLHSDDDSDLEGTPDVTDISQDYSGLKKSIMGKIQNKKLKAEIDHLLSLYHSEYVKQVSDNKNDTKHNQALLTEIAELNNKIPTIQKERAEIVKQLELSQQELASRNISIAGNIRRQYELLLVEVDKKDAEFITLKKEKENLWKKVQKLTSTIDQYQSPTKTFEKLAITQSNVDLLQSEVHTLKQKIADQDFVLEDMSVKHTRREEELMKRISEKKEPTERVYSTFLLDDKQVQVPASKESELKLAMNLSISTEIGIQSNEVEHAEAQTDRSLIADVSLQTDECMIIPMLEGLSSTNVSDAKLTTSFSSIVSSSSSGEFPFDTFSAEEECLADLRKCQSVIEQNQEILKNVVELQMLYIRDISKQVQRDSKLCEKIRKKEEELVSVKTELQVLEKRLHDTNEEFLKLKEQSCSDIFQGGKKQSSHRPNTPQSLQGCTACVELSVTIEELSKKLEDLQISDAVEKFRSNLEFHQKELDILHDSSRKLNTKYLKLKDDYERVLKMIQPYSVELNEDLDIIKKDPHCGIC